MRLRLLLLTVLTLLVVAAGGSSLMPNAARGEIRVPSGKASKQARPVCSPAFAQAALLKAFPRDAIYFNTYVDPVTGNSVNPVIVMCGRDVTHDRRPDMIARVNSGGSAGIGDWEVFSADSGLWQLVGGSMHDNSGDLRVLPDEDIEMTSGADFYPDDAHCCPSGGWIHSRYHWTGRRFVISKQWRTGALDKLVISPLGLGPIRFGMTNAQASAVAGQSLAETPSVNSCTFWSLTGFLQPKSELVAFNGRLGYISTTYYKTAAGIHVGSSLAALRRAYGTQLRTGQSGSVGSASMRLFYDERSRGTTYTMEFDLIGGTVSDITAGSRHTIETFGECA